MCKIWFWQFCNYGGHIFPWKNANFGRFEVAFDRPEFDRTQVLVEMIFLLFIHNDWHILSDLFRWCKQCCNKYLHMCTSILYQILQSYPVFKYYLNTQILVLLFKYLQGVFKYWTIHYSVLSQEIGWEEPRITKTTPYNSPGTLVLYCQKSPQNSNGVTPNRCAKQVG